MYIIKCIFNQKYIKIKNCSAIPNMYTQFFNYSVVKKLCDFTHIDKNKHKKHIMIHV